MLYRLPEIQSDSEQDEADSVDSDEFIGHPAPPPSESEDSEAEGSVGAPSPDDQEAAGEEDGPVVVLRQFSCSTSCASCGGSAFVAAIGEPDALSTLEILLYSERVNLICPSCAEDLDPLNRFDGRE